MHELHTIYTRCADSCKIVTIGCTAQLDDPKIERVSGMIPFEVFIEHYKNTNTREHKLVKNWRGAFAAHADEIQKTIKQLKEGN
jgi:predicted ribonuclease YlaK